MMPANAPNLPATVVEFPFFDDLLPVVTSDLSDSRASLQRLIVIEDALLGTSITLPGAFLGLAFANRQPVLAVVAIPILLALWLLASANWVHFWRVKSRISVLEKLFDAYVTVLREAGAARPQALNSLRVEIDGYSFGIEKAFDAPTFEGIWKVNRRVVGQFDSEG